LLAEQVTLLVHGEEAVRKVRHASTTIFGGASSSQQQQQSMEERVRHDLEGMMTTVPSLRISPSRFQSETPDMATLVVELKITKTKGIISFSVLSFPLPFFLSLTLFIIVSFLSL
jgi:hypothetical protein